MSLQKQMAVDSGGYSVRLTQGSARLADLDYSPQRYMRDKETKT